MYRVTPWSIYRGMPQECINKIDIWTWHCTSFLFVTSWPDLRAQGHKIFRTCVEMLPHRLYQIWRRCAPLFLHYLRKAQGGGCITPPPGRASVNINLALTVMNTWRLLTVKYIVKYGTLLNTPSGATLFGPAVWQSLAWCGSTAPAVAFQHLVLIVR